MDKKWIFTNLTPEQEDARHRLVQYRSSESRPACNELIADLLVRRGITTPETANEFFHPDLTQLHDPFLIKDMDRAVARLNRAVHNKNKEKILIYGDYDVDGTTAVSLVYKCLKRYDASLPLGYYIPNRYTEGYGVSQKGVEYARDNGYTLIITLDCGIKAIDNVARAAAMGIDTIICDHHTTDDQLPVAIAVLDSKREDDSYPYKGLSGCGVGFKFMQAFYQHNNVPFEALCEHLDLVAVSIASDIVPLTGENRVLAWFGLQRLNTEPCPGLQGIINVCKMKQRITINDIVFRIGPRINASGRMHSGHEVVELLISEDPEVVRQKSSSLNSYNEERREIDKDTTEDAKMLIENENHQQRHGIVVYNATWHKGIVGIVASRLVEEYYRPTVVLTKSADPDILSGSARSIPGFDLYAAIDSCRDLLENFGGHMYAAGLSLKAENLDTFSQRFDNYVAEHIAPDLLIPQENIDIEITFAEITDVFLKQLKSFAPFGPENMRPVFCTRRVYDFKRRSRTVGKGQDHLRLELIDASSRTVMNGIAFNMKQFAEPLQAGQPMDICYTIGENTFNGVTSLQLQIHDIKYSEEP